MVKRLWLLVTGALLVAACATVDLDRDGAATVIEEAFADGGVTVSDIEVGEEKISGSWFADALVEGDPAAIEVDAGRGAIVAIDLGESDVDLTDEQLGDIAAYAENPDDRAAVRGRWATLFALIAVGLAVGYLLARRAMKREQAGTESAPA